MTPTTSTGNSGFPSRRYRIMAHAPMNGRCCVCGERTIAAETSDLDLMGILCREDLHFILEAETQLMAVEKLLPPTMELIDLNP